MTENEVNKKVKSVLAESAGIDSDEITDESKFGEDLGLDSLDEVEAIMEIEEEFEIEICDADAESCKTVKDLIDLVLKLSK